MLSPFGFSLSPLGISSLVESLQHAHCSLLMHSIPDDAACADTLLILQLISMYHNIVMLICTDAFPTKHRLSKHVA